MHVYVIMSSVAMVTQKLTTIATNIYTNSTHTCQVRALLNKSQQYRSGKADVNLPIMHALSRLRRSDYLTAAK